MSLDQTLEKMQSGPAPKKNAGGGLAVSSVSGKLKPIFMERAAEVAETVAAFNAAEDEFIAKKLGASSLEMNSERLDVAGFFETL